MSHYDGSEKTVLGNAHQRTTQSFLGPGRGSCCRPDALRFPLPRLPAYNSVNLLIIDQAEQLSLILAQCIRSSLFDDQICTLLLVGSSALMTTLHRDPALESRVLTWRTITDFDSPNNSIIAIKKH